MLVSLQVVSSTDTPPAVVEVDCSLPVSRLLALSNIVWNPSSSTQPRPQQNAKKRKESILPDTAPKKTKQQRHTASASTAQAHARPDQSAGAAVERRKKLKSTGSRQHEEAAGNSELRDKSRPILNHVPDNAHDADFSNLDLLATFASTQLPIAVISM